ncbi:hypothetical protein BH11ARM1_BH11ARM1_17080 [soil metagenome]
MKFKIPFILVPIIVISVAAWVLTRPETYEHASITIVSAIEKGDAKSLIGYISDEEQKETNRNEQTVERLLAFWQSKCNGFKRTLDMPVKQGLYSAYMAHVYTAEDGRKTSISFAMRRENGRVVAYTLTNAIVGSALHADWPATEVYPNDSRRNLFYIAEYERERSNLEQTGVTGMQMDGDEESTFQTRSWTEYVQFMKDFQVKWERENVDEAVALHNLTDRNPLYAQN